MAGDGDGDVVRSDSSVPTVEPTVAAGDGDSDGESSHDSMPELEAAEVDDQTGHERGDCRLAPEAAEARLDAALEAVNRGRYSSPSSLPQLESIRDSDDDGDGSSSHASMPELEPTTTAEEDDLSKKEPVDGTFSRDTTRGCVPGRMPMDEYINRRMGLPPDTPQESEAPKPDSSDWFGKSSNPQNQNGFQRPHISDEECEELFGYPKWSDEQRDPEWWHEEWKRMQTDPRHNKNLNRGTDDPEFWHEAARVPWAKTMLRKEQHWTARRDIWTRQWEKVNQMNISREEICDLLEDCSSEIKRLVTPILKYKVVESLLYQVNQEAKKKGIPFKEHVMEAKTLANLHGARKRIDQGGDAEGARLQDEMDHLHKVHSTAYLEAKKKEETERGRLVIDMQGLKVALDFGQKCKKDGLVEWQLGHWEEAIASWRQGDDALKRYRAPWQNVRENTMLAELHSAVLKNLAQAAIKLEYWNEALDAADKVVDMNPDDHKAWFRRACALEGLGKVDESAACLDRIETIAVGRPDRERIDKDVRLRRDKIQALKERDKAVNQRMVKGSIKKGFFSSDRVEQLQQQPAKKDAQPARYVSSPAAREAAAQAVRAQDPHVLSPEVTDEAPAKAKPARPKSKVRRGLRPGEKPSQKRSPAAEEDSLEGHIARLGAAPGTDSSARARRRLTKNGAEDILDDLEQAYANPWFVERVDKLVQDMNYDPAKFMAHLGRSTLALDVQQPILEKWGFDVSSQGVADMSLAIQEHTRGRSADPALKKRADEVGKGLYGSPDLGMFEAVHGT